VASADPLLAPSLMWSVSENECMLDAKVEGEKRRSIAWSGQVISFFFFFFFFEDINFNVGKHMLHHSN